jgi:hypothetical protein
MLFPLVGPRFFSHSVTVIPNNDGYSCGFELGFKGWERVCCARCWDVHALHLWTRSRDSHPQLALLQPPTPLCVRAMESLQVFVRVRPPISREVKLNTAITITSDRALTLVDEKRETQCSYDHIFSEVSQQEEVFEKIKPLLVDVLSGVNSCIFAYGQTSAGKSYTMIGPNGGQDIGGNHDWGILPRASEFLLGYLCGPDEVLCCLSVLQNRAGQSRAEQGRAEQQSCPQSHARAGEV